MNNDKKAVKALKAAQTLIDYLTSEESYCSNTLWVDLRGYALHCDVGYFFDGLTKLTDLLVIRLRGGVPEYPQSCKTYNQSIRQNKRGDADV